MNTTHIDSPSAGSLGTIQRHQLPEQLFTNKACHELAVRIPRHRGEPGALGLPEEAEQALPPLVRPLRRILHQLGGLALILGGRDLGLARAPRVAQLGGQVEGQGAAEEGHRPQGKGSHGWLQHHQPTKCLPTIANAHPTCRTC